MFVTMVSFFSPGKKGPKWPFGLFAVVFGEKKGPESPLRPFAVVFRKKKRTG